MAAKTSSATASTGVIDRLRSVGLSIRSIFNAIRKFRVVLRHLEACLQELFHLKASDIETLPVPRGDHGEPTAVLIPSETHQEEIQDGT